MFKVLHFIFLHDIHYLVFVYMWNSSSKFRTSNGIVGLQRDVSQVSGSHLKGQSCYVEVTLGFPTTGDNDAHNSNLKKSLLKHHDTESSAVASGIQKGLDQFSVSERTFIYPVEAVIVPVLQTSFARSSLKRYIYNCGPFVAYCSLSDTLGENAILVNLSSWRIFFVAHCETACWWFWF